MQLAAKQRQVQPQQIGMIMESEKIVAFDKVFMEYDCDENEIQRGVKEYKLTETDEFKQVIAGVQEHAKQLMAQMS